MTTAASSSPSLVTAAATGEPVRVETILFDSLRRACSELGVHEGDVIRCRRASGSQLLLETDRGRTVPLRRDWARFIQVTPARAERTPLA